MLDKVFKSKVFVWLYNPLLFLLACTVVLKNEEINGTVVFAYITAATLILSSRLTDAMLPAMLLCVFVTRCYGSADTFLAKVPYFVPAVIAIIAHFIIYRNKLRIGRSFFGLCGVALAVTLGGLGTITASDYFAGGALYYVFGLGIGMIIFYLLVKSNFTEESAREVARVMYITGLFACFCVLRFYAADWEMFMETKRLVVFQSSNNLATFLMLAMPFPLFYASRRYVDVLAVVLMYACTFLTGSRGGLLMGTVEFAVILVAFAIFDNTRIFNHFFYALVVGAFVYVILQYLPDLAAFYNFKLDTVAEDASIWDYLMALKDYFIQDDGEKSEARVRLLERMVEDFKANPVFGVGIGYTGNSDIYNPQKGAMNWYHMWFAQVIGGLGVLGILTYGYQLIERLIVFFKNISLLNFTFLLSYFGLFIMSQVNPGEFCPMPYAALAVTFFIVMEKDDIDLKAWWSKTKEKFKKKTA
ncbi:MAG: O-antigen ligase family protein [Clostridia bacterium]|nr:O-antigen ligase family protein [Clostridia bacterium]